MDMDQAPPARGSALQEIMVQPCGPHHFIKCSGLVNALNTSSRGASKMRMTTSSRSLDSTPGSNFAVCGAPLLLLVAAILLLLHSRGWFVPRLKLLQILVKPVEALFPETTIFL